MTLKELIQRAVDIANLKLTEASQAEQAAEALLPAVFGSVATKAAGSPRLRTTLRRTKTVAVVSGAATLTDDVLTAYIDEANLIDPSDTTKLYSLVSWHLYTTGQLDERLGYFTIKGETLLHVRDPFETYDPSGGMSASLQLTVPCVPEIPALVTDDVNVTDEVADELITALAAALVLAGV